MISSAKLKPLATALIVGLSASLNVTSAFAQKYSQSDDYQRDSYGQDAEYVVVYEDCYFRGKSRALTVGEYENVRNLNIRNDSISSAKVPAGMQLVLFEDERLRGKSTVINSDVKCLNKNWNDEASSIAVSSDRGYGNYRNNGERRSSNRNNDRNDDGRYGNRRIPNEDTYRGNSGRNFTKGITYVAFVGTALEKSNGKRWQIANNNGSVDTFRETKRDFQTIYLVNNRIDQKVEIDLSSNLVRFIAPNGQQIDYPVTGKESRPIVRSSVKKPSGAIKGSCFDYKVYTDGGLAGIRFSHDHEAFFQYDRKPHRGRVCHQGELTMEINKKKLSTNVTVEINGEKYRFAKGEKEDTLLNTWYRKFIKLNVKR